MDLVPVLARAEIVRSLRTRALPEARRRATLIDARLYVIFDHLRTQPMNREEADALIECLCDEYLRKLVGEDRQRRAESPEDVFDGESADLLEDVASDVFYGELNALESGSVSHAEPEARERLAAIGVEADDALVRRLAYELARTRLLALKHINRERQADVELEPRPELPLPAAPVQAAARTDAPPPGRMLSEVIRLYIEDHEGKTWSPRTAQMTKSELARFLEIVGDKPVNRVTKDDVRSYRATLEKLPAHMGTKYKDMSVTDVLATNPEPGLKPETLRKFISYVIGLFNHAVKMEWLEKNPAAGMRPPRSKRGAQEERDAFSEADLSTLFGADYVRKTIAKGRPDRFWIPLIMLHTGARLEEVAQLEVVDVVEVEGIPSFQITTRSDDEESEKQLKTEQSLRAVPIHSFLLNLGFLDYVDGISGAGHRRLWPMLEKGRAAQRYGDAISKWFGRWKRERGITSKKKVLYSTRHTVITALKHQHDVKDSSISELVGHVVEGMTMGRYGKKLDVPRLREVVEKLDFSGTLAALVAEMSQDR
jgi:integrase